MPDNLVLLCSDCHQKLNSIKDPEKITKLLLAIKSRDLDEANAGLQTTS